MKFDEKIKGSRLLRENDKISETFDEILLGRDEQTNAMEKEIRRKNRDSEGGKR